MPEKHWTRWPLLRRGVAHQGSSNAPTHTPTPLPQTSWVYLACRSHAGCDEPALEVEDVASVSSHPRVS